MTERRDPEKLNARSAPARPKADPDAALLDLGRQAGNKAMAELLGQQAPASATSRGSAGVRIRDAVRAGSIHAQREFSLGVQRDAKQLKEPGRLLSVGTQGGDVAEVQQLLGLTADGVFGDQTHASVLAFQRANGLSVDGIVGPLTWSALASAKGSGAAVAEKIPTSAEKMPSSTDKIPGSTDKIPETAAAFPETTEKIPQSTDKIPESTDKIPSSTEKIPTATDKIPESTDKLEGLG